MLTAIHFVQVLRLLVGVVLGPLAVAIVVELLVANALISPLLLVATGVVYFTMANSLARAIARTQAANANGSAADAFEGDWREVVADNPMLIIFVPLLVTGSWIAAAIGCLWLIAVDYRVGLIVIALLVVAVYAWQRGGRNAV